MNDWFRRRFSDNVEAQKTIVIVAGLIGGIGFILFAVAAVLMLVSK